MDTGILKLLNWSFFVFLMMPRTSFFIKFLFVLCLYTLTGCSKKSDSASSLPSLTIADISQDRQTTNSTYGFTVSLSKASTVDVNMHYATVAGTAQENKDFIPASGTFTIPANSLSAKINVTVTPDSLRKTNQIFYVQLDNIQNATFKIDKGTGTIVNINGTYLPVDNTGYSTPDNYAGYQLDWNDEFNGRTINTDYWNFEKGNNNGWGNNELENYTDLVHNAFVSTGNLIIEARNENYNGGLYTSARMTTQNKKSFQFGRIDIRAKLPAGKGIWPALWMLGNNIASAGWPACGEMDIMEIVGHEPNKLYGTLHFGASVAQHESYGKSYVLPTGTFDQQFHVYSLLWEQDTVKILVDDHEYVSATNSTIGNPDPFNSSFFFIFNVAVGGNWPGAPDQTTVFPARLVVDYVRVFKKL